MKTEMKIGLSLEELKKRCADDYLMKKVLLTPDSPEYAALQEGDRKALTFLVKAADVLEDAFLKLDDVRNIPFRTFLEQQVAAGSEEAALAMKLFKAQHGMNATDREATCFSLLEGASELPGKGVYPQDLTVEALHEILIRMLKAGKTDEVRKILNQRSVVSWDSAHHDLTAADYTEAFSEEFGKAAAFLEEAAACSTNADFAEFLKLQASALTVADPMADARADKKWAELEDTPLEFTITRENYADEMTGTVYDNPELVKLLEESGITPVPKDMLGFRVGIVNPEGTRQLTEIRKYLPELAKRMPFADRYSQNISSESADVKQTMVDVDLVTLGGDSGAYRAGITIAENLPNDDKLSLTIGGGRRNVYHRQIRKVSDYAKLQKRLDAVLDPALHQFYNDEADHWFTIGHENGHSLGPNSGTEALGATRSIIEENKADMISISMLDALVELGMYTELQKKQILTTFVADNVLKAKPNMSQAHRVRTVMQLHFFIQEGAVAVSNGTLTIDYEKLIPAARRMLEMIIDIQLSGSSAKADSYVNSFFVWTDDMETLAQRLRQADSSLNGMCVEPLKDMLLGR